MNNLLARYSGHKECCDYNRLPLFVEVVEQILFKNIGFVIIQDVIWYYMYGHSLVVMKIPFCYFLLKVPFVGCCC